MAAQKQTAVVDQQPEPAPLPPPGLLGQAPADKPDAKRNVDDRKLDNVQKCGCWEYRPAFLQRFANARWILFNLSWGLFTQSFIVNGCLSVVIPTIERRFQLKSFESGMILSSYNIVNCLLVVPVSYMGSSRSKPLFAAVGLFLIATGSIVFSSPYFLAEPYMFGQEQHDGCPADNTTTSCISTNVRNWRYVLMLGHMLNGAGVVPFHTLGIAYMDENLPMRMTSTYVGIYLAMGILGPAFGFLFAGTSLSYYEDLSDVSKLGLTSKSSVWVGAWWTGFFFGGIFAFFWVLPLGAFPRRTPDYDRCQEERMKEKDSAVCSEYGKDIRQLPRDIKSLLKNYTFVFLSLGSGMEAMMASSLTSYVTKYYQSQFALTPSTAAGIIGLIAIPSGCGGTFIGGAVVTKFNMKTRSMIRMCWMTGIVAWLSLLVFVLHCPTPTFAINRDAEGEARFALPCNTVCNCKSDVLNPICSVDNVVYFSPCYAGCTQQDITKGGATSYRNCSCIDSYKASGNGSTLQAIREKCPTNCNLLLVVSACIFVGLFFTLFNTPPAVTATLRVVHQTERAAALAVKWMSIRLFGTIPAPLVVGTAIDTACVVWQHTCGRRGSCVYYDNAQLARSMLLTLLPMKTLTIIVYFCAEKVYREPEGQQNAAGKIVAALGDGAPQMKSAGAPDRKQDAQPIVMVANAAKPALQI
ncbi:solute carrier organic anion transporter family member 4A1-like [Ornithodoros turicata]|uniref:solute carrier organic anion transporter family member 4A1-like n=1 Tax=Ornithodoros turicata TaxID=34597 RepID=UPI003138F511